MDEYLFIELAKLQADRRRLEREQREAIASIRARKRVGRTKVIASRCASSGFASSVEQAVMKTFIAVVASLLVNAGACSVGSSGAPTKRRFRRWAKC